MGQLVVQTRLPVTPLVSLRETAPKLPPTTAQPVNRPTKDQLTQQTATGQIPAQDQKLHLIFFADVHSRQPMWETFLATANQVNPDLLIEGGDFVHDGTEPELKRAYAQRQDLKAPLYMVNGNHDADLRGPFNEPPPVIPPFQSFDRKGVHFILLDNENETLSETQFSQLEADLKANQGKPTVVAMHVPALLSKEGTMVKISKVLPIHFASPKMHVPEQVERFTTLMSQYKVKAVLTGHTHADDEVVKDGVRYITASSVGGLTPGLGIQHEYLDITIDNGELHMKRVPLNQASKNPLKYAIESLDYYNDLNQFNHEQLGWNYIPTANFEYRAGIKQTHTKGGSDMALTASVQGDHPTKSGKGAVFAAVTLAGGAREASAHVAVGYKHHLIGNVNKGLYVSGAAGLNGGLIGGHASAGVGARVAAGVAYQNLTLEAGQEWATNYQAQTVAVGYRF